MTLLLCSFCKVIAWMSRGITYLTWLAVAFLRFKFLIQVSYTFPPSRDDVVFNKLLNEYAKVQQTRLGKYLKNFKDNIVLLFCPQLFHVL